MHPLATEKTLPHEVRDRSAWYGADLVGRTDWIERLADAEVTEVEIAVSELENSTADLPR